MGNILKHKALFSTKKGTKTMATKELIDRLTGNYCVVVDVNGKSKIKQVSAKDKVFEEARGFIGCKWLDHVRAQEIAPGIVIEFLVNDEGYIQWGSDPSKMNPIGTFIYNGGKQPDHYILGDIVFCLCVDGEEGGEFVGMSEELAKRIAVLNTLDVLPKANNVCPRPDTIADPVVTISSYETTEDLIKAIKGDKSVKPKEQTVIGGGHKNAEAQA